MKDSCDTIAIDEKKNSMAPTFLVEADSYTKGCKKVMHFLETTALQHSSRERNAWCQQAGWWIAESCR